MPRIRRAFSPLFLPTLLTAATALTFALAAPAAFAAAEPRPNVLWLVVDDLGYADIGANGCTDFATPHIDSLARHGVRFTAGYVSAPVCSPSRAGLVTGRWQTRFGHEFNHPLADRSPVGLPLDQKLAPTYFTPAGYVTGHVGKWHLGNPKLEAFSPRARGFSESVWFPGQRKLPPLTFFRHTETGRTDDRFVDEAIAREAADFVTRHRREPWFLYVAFLTPHQPLDVPADADAAFAHLKDPERRRCAAMMTLLDGAIGRILTTLRETGQEERTLIAFVSDNAAPPKNGSRNTPLRGHKGTLWEGGLRVPFLLQWKSTLPAGEVVHAPVTTLDLLPTALAATGIASGATFDGVNLLPFLRGDTSQPPHAMLFWRYGDQMAVRHGDWKLVRTADAEKSTALAPRLFNLRVDPGEHHDRYATQPKIAHDLQSQWDRWNRRNIRARWSADGTETPNP